MAENVSSSDKYKKGEKKMNILGNWEDFLPNETIELAKKLCQ